MAKILGVSIFKATKYVKDFHKYYKAFRKTDNYRSMVSCMSSMYDVMREYGAESFRKSTSILYDLLLYGLKDCEEELTDTFIVESKPYFQFDDEYFKAVDFNELDDQEKLDYIVWLARRSMLEHFHKYDRRVNSLSKLHLTNECRDTSLLVDRICEELSVDSKIIKIPAAFSDDINLYDGNGFHYFVMARLNGKDYIIDCTYRQFFRADANNIDRLGVIGYSGCDPGVFMLQNEERKTVALSILKSGWIRATDENFKHYLDGFTLSFRNGLYYEWLGQVDYSVGYTASDYLEFLNGDDLMTNYEPEDGLGKQEVPLTNKKLRFR